VLKAVLFEFSDRFIKTHSISRLKQEIENTRLEIDISDDECDFLDTIYLPSKYPVNSVIPDYEPDIDICNDCLEIAIRVNKSVRKK
jgi:HEPN domain-containing protein